MLSSGLRDKESGKDHSRHPNRNVDPEDRPPSDRAHKNPSDNRTESEANTHHRSPNSNGLSPLLGVGKGVGDDRERNWIEHRSAHRLQHPKHDEHAEIRSNATRQ